MTASGTAFTRTRRLTAGAQFAHVFSGADRSADRYFTVLARLNDVDGNPTQRYIVFGQAVGIHIDERFIKDGLLDTGAMRPIARAGYHDYFVSGSETK